MHDWYEKGLLDPDSATRSSSGVPADNDMILNDKVGALTDYGTRLDDTYVSRGATNTDFCLVGAPQPTKDPDDPTYVEARLPRQHLHDDGLGRLQTASRPIRKTSSWRSAGWTASMRKRLP